MDIRPERPADEPAIQWVNVQAFGGSTEADLVSALRAQARPLISLVADDDGEVVGHILFSPMSLTSRPELTIMGLAPMAVLPGRQREGIGSLLVRAGLAECRALGAAAAMVLGHPEYYPRFGFVPASRFGLASEYDVPDDVFMAVELAAGGLSGTRGVVSYHPAFARSI